MTLKWNTKQEDIKTKMFKLVGTKIELVKPYGSKLKFFLLFTTTCNFWLCKFNLQFVDEKVQWMHIDMAGPVWNEKKRSATGFGVSTLVEWVLKNSS